MQADGRLVGMRGGSHLVDADDIGSLVLTATWNRDEARELGHTPAAIPLYRVAARQLEMAIDATSSMALCSEDEPRAGQERTAA